MAQWQQFPTLIFLFLIFGFHVNAQDYRPFNPFQTYIFECEYASYITGGDRYGVYSLKVDSVFQRGNDSVFRFNRIGSGNSPNSGSEIFLNQDNAFGKELIEKPEGIYQFATSDADTFIIQTQVPIQTTWVFHSKSGLMATLISQDTASILGIVQDSIMSIELSNGDSILISKNYGLIQTPFFRSRPMGEFRLSGELNLYGIEELGLGDSLPRFKDFFNFLPGETFFQTSEFSTSTSDGARYDKKKVLERTTSSTNDSIIITWEVESASSGYMYDSLWNWIPSVSYWGIDTLLEYYVYKYPIFSQMLSSEIIPPSPSIGSYLHIQGPFFMEEWNNRLVYKIHQYGQIQSDGSLYNFEGGRFFELGEGIGYTYISYDYQLPDIVYWDELHCYQKLTDSTDQCFSIEEIVSNEASFPEFQINIYPNPVSNLLNLKWPIQSKPIKISLIDISGKIIYQASSLQPQAEINVESFPAGIYFLKMMMDGQMIKTKRISIVK